ncbi:MAG: ABC transporter ATP-binding protein [Planctomycetota bacterium]
MSAQKVGTVALETIALGRSYPRRDPKDPEYALDGLNLRLCGGEAVVLAGGNGAGKSTALRLIAGLEMPDRGRVRIFGRSPRSMVARRRTGYLPDQSELFPFLDWRETLDFFAAISDVARPEAKRRADAWGERFGLTDYGRKRVRAFSMGMRRRLGLAAVLMSEPELLLLDEPISGLDPEGMRLFNEVMAEQKARGTALLLSSHHLGQAETFCDRIVALRRGKVVSEGRIADLGQTLGAHDFTVSGLDQEGLEALMARAEELGAELSSPRVAESALEDLLVRGDDEA